MEYENVLFAIPRFTNGLVGRKYNSLREAIADGFYDAYTEERIKLAFNLGSGTLSDFKRFCKENKKTILTSKKFLSIFDSMQMSAEERQKHIDYIEGMINLSYRR